LRIGQYIGMQMRAIINGRVAGAALRSYVVKLAGGIRDNCEILRVSNKTDRQNRQKERKRERERQRQESVLQASVVLRSASSRVTMTAMRFAEGNLINV